MSFAKIQNKGGRRIKLILRKAAAALIMAALLIVSLCSCGLSEDTINKVVDIVDSLIDEITTVADAPATEPAVSRDADTAAPTAIDEKGSYYSKDEVALYIHTYGKLPSNYITKAEAEKLGWSGGSLEKYAPGKAIGGDKFGNYEGLLPKKTGRTYTECDIDTNGASSRGAKRIVFSNDGLIYYTDNHYDSFTLLYGEAGS